MDIYKFLNSKDIAEHCRNISHQFTSLEMAFIIYQSQATLSEKHNALKEIINTMPDEEVSRRGRIPYYDSLHRLLMDYMEMENEMIEKFKADEPNAIYNYAIYYINDDGMDCEENIPFSTLNAVVEAVKKENKDGDIEKCRIHKKWLDCDDSMTVYTNLEWEYISVEEYVHVSRSKWRLRWAFDDLWIQIPTPFEVGDIVFCSTYSGEPFVLTKICYWDETDERIKGLREKADYSDMTALGHWLNDAGQVYSECMHAYQDLEYYRGELKGKNRMLKSISNYLKGEIGLTLLLKAYEIIRHEEQVRWGRENLGYVDEYLELAGLLDDVECAFGEYVRKGC